MPHRGEEELQEQRLELQLEAALDVPPGPDLVAQLAVDPVAQPGAQAQDLLRRSRTRVRGGDEQRVGVAVQHPVPERLDPVARPVQDPLPEVRDRVRDRE